ncbi:MAG TPA: anti-sigma factor antagonist [Streptosporangiaceae bacterium]
MSLDISTAVADDVVTLVVRGEIDYASAPQFRLALDDAPARNRLVLDLTGVEYLDSAGVKVLYDHLGRRPELVVGADAIILRVLNITGLRDLLPVSEK